MHVFGHRYNILTISHLQHKRQIIFYCVTSLTERSRALEPHSDYLTCLTYWHFGLFKSNRTCPLANITACFRVCLSYFVSAESQRIVCLCIAMSSVLFLVSKIVFMRTVTNV